MLLNNVKLKEKCVRDLNSHFSNKYGSSFGGNCTKNAQYMCNIIETCQLSILDGDDRLCNGPKYSFHVEGVGTSYIDHCAVTNNLKECIRSCLMIDDCHSSLVVEVLST